MLIFDYCFLIEFGVIGGNERICGVRIKIMMENAVFNFNFVNVRKRRKSKLSCIKHVAPKKLKFPSEFVTLKKI